VIVGLASRACGFQIRPATKLGGAGAQLVASAGAPRDWSGEVGALFTNLRTPAALVAGATFGGAFGLPLSPADDLVVGIAKRLHVVVAVLSLGAELLVMIASTVALQGMSSAAHRMVPASTAADYIEANFELEWVACQVNFLFGVLGLTAMVALRTWVSIACPRLARAVLGCITSMMLIMVSMISRSSALEGRTVPGTIARYVRLLVERVHAQGGVFLLGGLVLGVASSVNLAIVLWHTAAHYLAAQA